MDEKKNKGAYVPLVGCMVRVFSGGTSFVGRLAHTDYDTTQLRPHLVEVGLPLGDRMRIVYDHPKIIITPAISTMEPLPVGQEYLERVVAETEERSKRDRFMTEKTLRKEGYFDKRDERQLEFKF